MPNKLIKDMNEETWRRFVAYCKLKNVRVGNELDMILGSHLKKNLRRMLE